MARWLDPRSTSARLMVQVLALLAGAGAVYLFVTWLGSSFVSAAP
jgi:hypothetical protein